MIERGEPKYAICNVSEGSPVFLPPVYDFVKCSAALKTFWSQRSLATETIPLDLAQSSGE